MMSGPLKISVFMLLYALSFSSAHYRRGLRDIADRLGRPDGERRLRDELCDEVERLHPRDDYWRREARRIRHDPPSDIMNDLDRLMDSLERRSRTEAERIFRETIARMKLTAPRRYWMLNGTWTPEAADRKCKDRGGQLAMIRSGAEHTLAWEATSRFTSRYHDKVFFGMQKVGHRVTWRDGSHVPWYRGEDRRYYHTKRCGVIHVDDGEMSFVHCTNDRPALCESAATSRPTTMSSPVPLRTTKSPIGVRTPNVGKPAASTRPPIVGKPSTGVTTPVVKKPTGNANSRPVRPYVETEIRFTFDYDKVMKYPTFKADLIGAIETMLKKKPGDVKILNVRRGSTIVHVRVYLKAEDDVEMIKRSLHNGAKSTGKLYGHFYGLLVPVIDPFPEPHPEPSRDHNLLKILVPVIICLIVGATIVIVVAVCMIKKRKSIEPRPNIPVSVIRDELPTYKEFTENDYTKPPSVTEAPPGYDDCVKAPIA